MWKPRPWTRKRWRSTCPLPNHYWRYRRYWLTQAPLGNILAELWWLIRGKPTNRKESHMKSKKKPPMPGKGGKKPC